MLKNNYSRCAINSGLLEVSDIYLLQLEEQSDMGPHCLHKWLLKSQADDKADDNCCNWQFKG